MTGMTLVELMVGMAVGLFVATVAIATFVSTRTLNVVSSSKTRVTENTRLAMELLQTDLRSSGFAGCLTSDRRWPDADPPYSVLADGVDAGFISDGVSALRGYAGSASGFSPALTTKLRDQTPLAGSDIVSVRVPADTAALGLVGAVTKGTDVPLVTPAMPANPIQQGDVVLIANCDGATMFQVTSNDPKATGVLSHAVGSSAGLGNKTDDLFNPDGKVAVAFDRNSTVYKLQTHHYYVARSVVRDEPEAKSLWRLSVPPNKGEAEAIEVASGVERLSIKYGIDTGVNVPENVNQYVDADKVISWDRVVSVRLEMLVTTPADGMARSPQSYAIDDKAPVTRTDRRLPTVLTEVVTLRNVSLSPPSP